MPTSFIYLKGQVFWFINHINNWHRTSLWSIYPVLGPPCKWCRLIGPARFLESAVGTMGTGLTWVTTKWVDGHSTSNSTSHVTTSWTTWLLQLPLVRRNPPKSTVSLLLHLWCRHWKRFTRHVNWLQKDKKITTYVQLRFNTLTGFRWVTHSLISITAHSMTNQGQTLLFSKDSLFKSFHYEKSN